jgi:hypothetical protein
MEKIICPQCGGNDFQLFGNSAYKCESCGTILKEEPEEKKVTPKNYPSSQPVEIMTSEERYGNDYPPDQADGNLFIRILVLGGAGLLMLLAIIYFS